MVEHPAECVPSSSCIGDNATAFRRPVAFGIRNSLSFRGCIPTAHTLAYLRFAHVVTDTGARLTTDLPDLGFGRTGFAPAGRLIQISRSYRLLLFHWTGIARSHQTETTDTYQREYSVKSMSVNVRCLGLTPRFLKRQEVRTDPFVDLGREAQELHETRQFLLARRVAHHVFAVSDVVEFPCVHDLLYSF